ncbi:type II toxin-antitoxin system RelE/ParE family toxin [Xanthomonas citri]|uniref:type II toxin-antitoxin system RelE/ParE family toxin n=1 Tax=Xanthomonas citri TaxID=346 RepID=UPI0001CECFE9|nr:type II toxin-antitoxin system RelE/ParE family toxin [Xanthomonas citri]AMU98499.1 plasmid stabilization protein [Xanthomonas citri pv. aurantifolii]AMV03395.1 plasmid stabilization protein [Xanthomonas citri pv. aurantifolii]EFF49084.1 plasmid protein [Xanthomonas citri pv. aurantifolii str. ICPB 10535]MCC8488458.1 type II toxin-antitoxin system RelE/ParE family toxin [Xanthomonas citri pv. fuscans]TBW94969.1 plasmid stabilization protein [Xanthomonas citri pv. aurantifolii]
MVSASRPYRVELRATAIEDLRAIVRYIGKDNPTRAKSFRAELVQKLAPLAQHPELGRPARPGLPEGMRELVVHRNYIAFYHVLAEAGIVEVVRVKHVAQQTP